MGSFHPDAEPGVSPRLPPLEYQRHEGEGPCPVCWLLLLQHLEQGSAHSTYPIKISWNLYPEVSSGSEPKRGGWCFDFQETDGSLNPNSTTDLLCDFENLNPF